MSMSASRYEVNEIEWKGVVGRVVTGSLVMFGIGKYVYAVWNRGCVRAT